MTRRATAAALLAAALALVIPRVTTAQTTSPSRITGTVNLNVPVKLTGLSPEVSQVQANCRIYGEGVTEPSSVPGGYVSYGHSASGGKVEATLVVPIPVAVDIYNAGKTATYMCYLKARRTNSSNWETFDPNSTIPALKVNVTQPIQGSFTW